MLALLLPESGLLDYPSTDRYLGTGLEILPSPVQVLQHLAVMLKVQAEQRKSDWEGQ